MKLKRLFRSSDGSVSIYFMITLSALFIFHAVLIDFARIKIAEKYAETALRAALRSTLSQFDKDLLAYGMFAISDRDAAEQMFRHIVQQHALQERKEGEFRLIDPSWEEASIALTFHHSLANHAVFKRQLLEEMKYRAPIEYIFEVVNKFDKTNTSAELQQTSTMTKQAGQLEEWIMERERLLDKAWELTEQLTYSNGVIAQLNRKFSSRLNTMKQLAEQIIALTIEIASWPEPDGSDEEDGDGAESDIVKKQLQLVELTAQLVDLVEETDAMTEQDYAALMSSLATIKEYLDEAMSYNERLEAGVNEQLEDVTSIKERTYFVQFEVGISNIVGLFSGFNIQFDAQQLLSGERVLERYDRLVESNAAYLEQSQQYYMTQRAIEQARMRENDELEQSREEQIEKTRNILSEVKQLVASCDRSDRDIYEQLDLPQPSIETIDLDDAEQIGKQAMRLIDRLGAGLLSMRDRAYVHEYALSKFNYRTLEVDQADGKLLHMLHNQEIEYILYGMSNCYLNQGAAFAEIFALRLAVRTAEALLHPEKMPLARSSPLLLILWAVSEGAKHAYEDMKQLVAGKDIELSAKLGPAVTLNYKDYLRIMLLIHGQETRVIARMQALIQLNTHVELSKSPTYVEGTATSTIRLWFIPAVLKMLYDDIDGREAKITKRIVLSY